MSLQQQCQLGLMGPSSWQLCTLKVLQKLVLPYSDEAPPVPLGTIPNTGMINTYEKAPQSRPGSKKKMNYADINFDGSPRRGESNKSRSHPNYLQSSDEDGESMLANMGTSASGNYANDEGDF